MNGDDGEQFELADEARALIIEAAQKSADTFEWAAGGIVTGYVLVVETTRPGEEPNLTWVSGNGMPTEAGSGGLPRWRMTGMLRDVITQIDASVWRWRLRGEE